MSSFQQFQRSSSISRSKKDNSRLSGSRMNESIRLDNLLFSTHELVYSDIGGGPQDTQSVIMSNRTSQRLYFKVTPNYPEYYDVRPVQDIVDLGASVRVIIRIRRERITREVIKGLSMHAFEFVWGGISEIGIANNQIPPTPHRQVITVRVVQSSQPPASYDDLYSPTKSFPSSDKVNSLKLLENMPSRLSDRQVPSLLTMPIIVGVATVSFLLGFLAA